MEPDGHEDPPSEGTSPGLLARNNSSALRVIARALWFALGALVATSVALVVLLRPFARHDAGQGAALPYETFPFANNAGVCQEFVALATELRTSHTDAADTARRLAGSLPANVRAENVRVVRAFAQGDYWTLAVDTQPGTGDLETAARLATTMNAIPGTGIRFAGVFYSPRRLYDTAGVLCLPRDHAPAH